MKRSKLDDSQFGIPNGRTNGLAESTIQNLPLIREFNLSNIFKNCSRKKAEALPRLFSLYNYSLEAIS